MLVVCISSPTPSTLGHSNHAATHRHGSRRPCRHSHFDKIERFSGEVTMRSNAAGFPRDQLGGNRTSAGLVLRLSCPKPLPTSTWADTLARLQHSTNMSQSLLWQETTSPPCLQVIAWWPKGSTARLGQKVQL